MMITSSGRFVLRLGAIFFFTLASCAAQSKAGSATARGTSSDVGPGPNVLAMDTIAQGRPSDWPFKKKIVTTAFAIRNLAQVADIDHIEQGLPRELLRRLDQTQQFLTHSSPDLLSFTHEQDTPSARLVQQVAAEHDSQFVIAGIIRNADVQIGYQYLGFKRTAKRHLEVEIAVYDGLSGALLAKHVVDKMAEDKGTIGREKAFGSYAFYATTYGQAISSLLNESVKLIAKDLESYPVMAKILKVSNGQIVIDAGKTSAITAGDLATVVASSNELPTSGSSQSRHLVYGMPYINVGKIAIIQAQQLFSVGELAADVKPDEVKVGDFVRFDNVNMNKP